MWKNGPINFNLCMTIIVRFRNKLESTKTLSLQLYKKVRKFLSCHIIPSDYKPVVPILHDGTNDRTLFRVTALLLTTNFKNQKHRFLNLFSWLLEH